MNRKEQIEKAAWEYAQSRSNDRGIAYLTFKDIAEWTDRTMMARVCEWVEDVDFEMTYIDSEGLFGKEQFINDLRKAMEE